jgi:hypothetical protein
LHLFSRINSYSLTCVAPHELQNLGGAFVLIYASDGWMIIIEIQIHAYIKGELFIKFGIQKL